MPSSGITGHLVVKNEDQWVWFAINSVLPYVDRLLITDTGSTDRTVEIIKNIKSFKIVFKQVVVNSPAEVTTVRQVQINATKTPWIWIIDGDEIYPSACAQEAVSAAKSGKYNIVVVRRYDLLGDVYHRQNESVGTYNLFGRSGHLLVRLINKDEIKGLHYRGDYPLEGFFDRQGKSILEYPKSKVYITENYLYHSMYLKRSSLGGNLNSMFNRSKYKIEAGLSIKDIIPEVFTLPRPDFVPDPLPRRGPAYELAAGLLTPIKNLKRRLL